MKKSTIFGILNFSKRIKWKKITSRVKYLFSEKTLLADEIVSIALSFTQTRNGKNYFILISQSNRKSLRISGLSPSLPIAYLVLKNWHKQNKAIGLTNQRN